jgi:glycerol-3-phosphate dehydrogenase
LLQKGVEVQGTNIYLFADTVENELGVRCSALSGANIANEGIYIQPDDTIARPIRLLTVLVRFM